MKSKFINSFSELQRYLQQKGKSIFDALESMNTTPDVPGTSVTLDLCQAVDACLTINAKFRTDSRTQSFCQEYKNRQALDRQYREYTEISEILQECLRRWKWVKLPTHTFSCTVEETLERNIQHWSTQEKI